MPVDVAIAIIRHPSEPRVLIQQRTGDKHLAGLWEFPGGKIEKTESPEECVVREVREETGLHVSVVRALQVIEHDYPERTVRIHPFLCLAEDGLTTRIADGSALWIAVEDLARYPFPQANDGLIEGLATGRVDVEIP